jgi:signal-transduction protein with cAMP-binding, CBS, and nucleotidyltransferase domain
MKVKDIVHPVAKIGPNATVSAAAQFMDKNSYGSLLIEDNNSTVGILTERDILRKVVAKGKNPEFLHVTDIMNKPIITIDADEDILKASQLMDINRIRRLIVTENGKIIGKVTANSIARNLKSMLVGTNKIPEDYIIR